jgi:Xaa-Pro aminopeptidase
MPVKATKKRTTKHASKRPPVMPASVLAARRKKFLSKLPPNSVAIFVSNPEATRSNDTEYKYRQSSNLIYLSGFPEPESALMLCNIKGQPKYTLFVRPKDRAQEIWTGIRAGVEGAKRKYHCDAAYTNDKFGEILSELLPRSARVYYRIGYNQFFDDQFCALWQGKQKSLYNPEEIINEMRLFKDTHELAMMQQAAHLSATAHCLAMRACRPGMHEYQLASILEASYLYNGANAPAYGSIVAGGENAVVLHYESNSCALKNGDLVLIDAAGEYQGYAADITRTFPVNGKFKPAQQEIYELVLDAQLAAIKAARPGKKLADVHGAACAVLEKGLKKLGILRGGARAKQKQGALGLRSFYMHGTSHWLGLDVHDVGDYKTGDGTRTDKGRGKQRVLKPGMVITVEPGLYFDAKDKRVPLKYRGIGIRIEDDVAITKSGNRVLTGNVPKSVDEIEKLMSQRVSLDPILS